jgi:transcriptional regulator GlxA family with amidase domain
MLELSPKSDRVQAALDYAPQEPGGRSVSVEELAGAVNLSPRQIQPRLHDGEPGRHRPGHREGCAWRLPG